MPEAPDHTRLDHGADMLLLQVGEPGRTKELSVKSGTIVLAALKAAHFPLRYDPSYEFRLGGRVVDLHDSINEASTLLVFRGTVRGEASARPSGVGVLPYWRAFLVDLKVNARTGWPLFAAIGLFWLGSSFVLFEVEGHGFPRALYNTWTTMATLGPLDGAPVSTIGKIFISLDAFAGLVVFGCVIWLVTTSLLRTGPPP